MVGQQYVRLLAEHPWFEPHIFVGRRSAGKLYGEAVEWIGEYEPPANLLNMPVQEARPEEQEADIFFSCLPSEVAKTLELEYVKLHRVISDTSAFRMEPDVPLIIPEVNPDHLELLKEQKRRGWKGFIVTGPNCTAAGLVMALKPLHDAFKLRKVIVATLQALSGAGYPGVPSLQIVDNVIPYIKNEEEKVARETIKMLGTLVDGQVKPAEMQLAAMCHRVATIDGHLESVYVETERPINPEDAKEVLREFKGKPQELRLPSAPNRPLIVREEEDRPQPRKDRNTGKGMSTVVGRVRRGLDDHSLRFTLLSHNTVRGAAGNAILTAELIYKLGLMEV
jgi:aspartate-semialdehyde dehydrogenase